jgi:hypothetical protein
MGVAGALAGVVTAAVLTQSKTSDFHPSLPDFNAAALQRAPAPAPALVQVRF